MNENHYKPKHAGYAKFDRQTKTYRDDGVNFTFTC